MSTFNERYTNHDDVRGKLISETLKLVGVAPERVKSSKPGSNAGAVRVVGKDVTAWLRLRARCASLTIEIPTSEKYAATNALLTALFGKGKDNSGGYTSWIVDFNIGNLMSITGALHV